MLTLRGIKSQAVISVAEVLEDVTGKRSNHILDLLYIILFSTEYKIAATCEHGTLHLNEGLMVIQKERTDEVLLQTIQ